LDLGESELTLVHEDSISALRSASCESLKRP
jgi:hypothetical protein